MKHNFENFDLLPENLLIIIFNYLSSDDLLNVRLTSKKWLEFSSNKNLSHFFWKRLESSEFPNGWKTRWHKTANKKDINFAQALYLSRRHQCLSRIVINVSQSTFHEINFQKPKDPQKFKELLEKANCALDPTLIKVDCFKTKDCLEALRALRNHLPSKLIEEIGKTLEEGSRLVSTPQSFKI